MPLLIIFFLVSILFSFICSVLEAVLLSVTPSYVRGQVAEGTSTGELLETYKQDIDKPLSAILTLNTIAHTVGAIGVGAQAGALFGSKEIALGPVSLSYESIIAGVMTLGILILSEIIPKTIGANNWRRLTPITVQTLRVLLFLLAPLVWLSQLITKSFKKEKDRSVLSRADFAVMTLAGEESGALDKSESTIIKNLLKFEKLTVRDIMTPKTVIGMSDGGTTLAEFYKKHNPLPFSRIPIFKNTRDNITGFVLKDDIYQALAEDQHDLPLEKLRRDINFVPDNLPLPGLFEFLTEERRHLSIVTDEFGSVVGLVTMEDLFETLLGKEIIDETDEVDDMQELARKRWEDKRSKKGEEK